MKATTPALQCILVLVVYEVSSSSFFFLKLLMFPFKEKEEAFGKNIL